MPNVGEVGNIALRAREFTVEWKVGDFFSLSDKVNDIYNSPAFSFAGSRWCLLLYPNGWTGRTSSEGWVDLLLQRLDPGLPKSMRYTFGIRTADGQVKKKQENKSMFSIQSVAYGAKKLCLRSELRDRKSTFLPSGVMTVTCDLRSEYRCVLQGNEPLKKEVESLKGQIKTLQENVEKSEVESENYKKQISALESEKSSIAEQHKSLLDENSTTVSRLEKGNEQLEKEVESLMGQIKTLQKTVEKYEMESENYKERISALKSEKSFIAEQCQSLLEEKSTALSRLEKDNFVLERKGELLMGEMKSLHKILEKYELENGNYKKQISATEREMSTIAEKYKSLLEEKSKGDGSKKVETLTEPVKTPSKMLQEVFELNAESRKKLISALQPGLRSVLFYGIFIFFLLSVVLMMP